MEKLTDTVLHTYSNKWRQGSGEAFVLNGKEMTRWLQRDKSWVNFVNRVASAHVISMPSSYELHMMFEYVYYTYCMILVEYYNAKGATCQKGWSWQTQWHLLVSSQN